MASKKQLPVTSEAKPVLAPSATPAVDSAKVLSGDAQHGANLRDRLAITVYGLWSRPRPYRLWRWGN